MAGRTRPWNEGREESREGHEEGVRGRNLKVECLNPAVRKRDAHEMIGSRNQPKGRALLDDLPARAEDDTLGDSKRVNAQTPPYPEVSRALVPAVVEPRDLNRKAGERNGEVGVGEREVAALLEPVGNDRNVRRRGVAVRVEDGQAQRVGAVQEERRVERPEDAVRDLRRALAELGERRVARGLKGEL